MNSYPIHAISKHTECFEGRAIRTDDLSVSYFSFAARVMFVEVEVSTWKCDAEVIFVMNLEGGKSRGFGCGFSLDRSVIFRVTVADGWLRQYGNIVEDVEMRKKESEGTEKSFQKEGKKRIKYYDSTSSVGIWGDGFFGGIKERSVCLCVCCTDCTLLSDCTVQSATNTKQ